MSAVPTGDHISRLERDGRVFHLIGTAHVSRKSVEEVQESIRAIKPDTVCVELDEMRYESMTDESRWRKLDVFQVIKQRKVLFLLATLALQSFQRRLGDQLGVKPGAELLAAVETAEEVGAEVVLADRNVQVTLRRVWRKIGFIAKVKLLMGLVYSVLGAEDEEITEEDIEALKDREHFATQLAAAMPEVKAPLIDERDQYLMSKVEEAPGNVVVAVVGAGHVPGMEANFGKTVDRDVLDEVPPPSKLVGMLKWVIPLIILAAFYHGYAQNQGKALAEMLYAWVLPNAIFAGLATAIAGGRLLTVLTAFVASPITSLNPTIGAGMAAGLVEAWLRKPTVEDCERLGTEVNTWAGMRRNPVSRVFLVLIAANLGSALGAYVGLGWVLSYL